MGAILRSLLAFLLWRLRYAGPRARGAVARAGARISYASYGTGAPLVLLHGGLGSRWDWFSQIPAFVRSGRRVLVIDSRGHGASTLGGGEYSYRALADDVAEVIGACGLTRCDVVGWSDGGNAALLLARDHAACVRRLVVISANFSPAGLTPEARERIDRDPWLRRLRRRLVGSGSRLLVSRVHRLWRTLPRLTAADLGQVSAPALVLVGDRDDIDTGHARQMARALANARLRILPHTGHAAPVTQAALVNRLVLEFLDAPDTRAHARCAP